MRRLARALLFLLAIAGGLLALVALTSKLYRVPTSSMEPTLHCPKPHLGCLADEPDRVAVSRVLYRLRDPKRRDLVAYRIPTAAAGRCGAREGATFVHRIVGLPGERWRAENGFIYINGKKLAEPYLADGHRGGRDHPAQTIPDDRYLVLGDNRPRACDSTVLGLVSRERMIGPVIATYWPLKRISIR